jgi:mono/diheme cytochrome c family protein
MHRMPFIQETKMSLATRKTLIAPGVIAGIGVLAAAGFVWSGAYDVGADEPHWPATHAVLETLRQRSINVRASKLQVPSDLANPSRIRQGAGNYAAMCSGCHLSPGVEATEMSKGLYPSPPNLTRQAVEASRAFWAIKHGIKASGMPAWGKSMEDEYIWNMAAFLQELPRLDAAGYQALVDSSGGHSHGGGETKPHEHEHGSGNAPPHEHDGAMARNHHEGNDADPRDSPATPRPHTHAPGTPPHQDAPATSPEPASEPVTPPSTTPESHDEHDHHQPL